MTNSCDQCGVQVPQEQLTVCGEQALCADCAKTIARRDRERNLAQMDARCATLRESGIGIGRPDDL